MSLTARAHRVEAIGSYRASSLTAIVARCRLEGAGGAYLALSDSVPPPLAVPGDRVSAMLLIS